MKFSSSGMFSASTPPDEAKILAENLVTDFIAELHDNTLSKLRIKPNKETGMHQVNLIFDVESHFYADGEDTFRTKVAEHVQALLREKGVADSHVEVAHDRDAEKEKDIGAGLGINIGLESQIGIQKEEDKVHGLKVSSKSGFACLYPEQPVKDRTCGIPFSFFNIIKESSKKVFACLSSEQPAEDTPCEKFPFTSFNRH